MAAAEGDKQKWKEDPLDSSSEDEEFVEASEEAEVEIEAAVEAKEEDESAPQQLSDAGDENRCQMEAQEFGAFEFEPLYSEITEDCLTEEWKQRALRELEEKGEWRARDIQALRGLVNAEENFVCDTSDFFLLRFLRAKKFDYDAALRMIKRYLGLRARSPANFERHLPSHVEKILECQLQNILPHRDHYARRVFMFRAGKWDTSIVSPQDIFSTNYMCLELMSLEPKTQVSGIVAIVDMADFGWDHFMRLSLDYIKDMVAMVQNSFPIRFREIHIVNESYLFDMAFALVKPFLTEKIRNRIRFHGSDMESLTRALPKQILPMDYGGDQPPFDNGHMKIALADMEEHFAALKTYGFRDNLLPNEVYDRDSHPFPSFCMSGTLPE